MPYSTDTGAPNGAPLPRARAGAASAAPVAGEPSVTHFGQWLREAIAEAGLPIKEFARRVPVGEPTVHGWLKRSAPNLRAFNITRIALVLGVDRRVVDDALTAARSAGEEAQ